MNDAYVYAVAININNTEIIENKIARLDNLYTPMTFNNNSKQAQV